MGRGHPAATLRKVAAAEEEREMSGGNFAGHGSRVGWRAVLRGERQGPPTLLGDNRALTCEAVAGAGVEWLWQGCKQDAHSCHGAVNFMCQGPTD